MRIKSKLRELKLINNLVTLMVQSKSVISLEKYTQRMSELIDDIEIETELLTSFENWKEWKDSK